jgi:hypothetical protein
MNKFLFVIALILIGIPLGLLRGVVIQDLVDWYTPWHVGVVQAIGLGMIVSLFTFRMSERVKPAGEEWWEHPINQFVTSLLLILFAWFFGWLWHFFL